mmetsp:Transcript_5949/g.16815  ORF Transcript_5949/g.16815 Transcript_5949/m.16815 type:complete len:221 (-) Transcript_5949:64-726(-)
MGLTEKLLADVAVRSTARTRVEFEGASIDFAGPYQRVHVWNTLAERVGRSLPHPRELEGDAARQALLAIVREHDIPMQPPYSSARLVDKLVGHFLEPACQQPTFLTHQPIVMSPLARELRDADGRCTGLAERFELVVAGREVVNAYSELSDPEEQRARFGTQARQREEGDREAASGEDERFCAALEYGLPPTAGWGLGVDRLCMILSRSHNLRDVIPFPL